jgi:hypothetical protein
LGNVKHDFLKPFGYKSLKQISLDYVTNTDVYLPYERDSIMSDGVLSRRLLNAEMLEMGVASTDCGDISLKTLLFLFEKLCVMRKPIISTYHLQQTSIFSFKNANNAKPA